MDSRDDGLSLSRKILQQLNNLESFETVQT
jgi:hypothetical protein